MIGFTTVYGCLFCEKVHGSKDTISQHLDAHLPECRCGRPAPTLDAQENHPAAIIRAVRSLVSRRKQDPALSKPKPLSKPMRVEKLPVRDECSSWNLVIELVSDRRPSEDESILTYRVVVVFRSKGTPEC